MWIYDISCTCDIQSKQNIGGSYEVEVIASHVLRSPLYILCDMSYGCRMFVSQMAVNTFCLSHGGVNSLFFCVCALWTIVCLFGPLLLAIVLSHCVQSSTAKVVWFHFRLARKDVRTREVGTFLKIVLSRNELITQALQLSFSRYSFASKHIQC